MSHIEKDIKKYIKQIKSFLPNGYYENRFLEDFGNDLFMIAKEDKIIDFSDIQNRFGTPSKIAGEFLSGVSDEDADYILKQVLKAKRIHIFIVIFLIGCIIVLSIYGAYNHKEYKDWQEKRLPIKIEDNITID